MIEFIDLFFNQYLGVIANVSDIKIRLNGFF